MQWRLTMVFKGYQFQLLPSLTGTIYFIIKILKYFLFVFQLKVCSSWSENLCISMDNFRVANLFVLKNCNLRHTKNYPKFWMILKNLNPLNLICFVQSLVGINPLILERNQKRNTFTDRRMPEKVIKIAHSSLQLR